MRTIASRTRRRADRRRRPVRDRGRLPPAAPLPGQDATRSSRRATRSAAPGTCSATRGSARTPTCTRSGYSFRPWKAAKAIADGPSILQLHPRDRRRVRRRPTRSASATGWSRADWSQRRRALDRHRRAHRHRRDGRSSRAGFLLFCSGYYHYDQGYTPEFPGIDRFQGPIVHPQHWPEDLDYAGKRVVVIGSGATAVTLVPAMAEDGRARDDAPALADLRRLAARARTRSPGALRRVLPPMAAYQAVRWKNVGADDAQLPAQPPPAAAGQGADPQGRRAPAARGLRRRHPLHAHATTPGTSGCACVPTATCSGRSATAARRS